MSAALVLRDALLRAAYGEPPAPAASFDRTALRRILAIRRNGIGDMIWALPLLRHLRRAAMKKPAFVLYPRNGNPQLWAPYGVPFEFVRSRDEVSGIEPDEVAHKLDRWIAALERRN